MHDLLTGNEESITAMLRDHTERAHSITRGIATLALEARELLQLTDLPIGQLERAAEVSGFAHEATKGYLDTLDGVADSVRG
jgi:hypothetical protein